MAVRWPTAGKPNPSRNSTESHGRPLSSFEKATERRQAHSENRGKPKQSTKQHHRPQLQGSPATNSIAQGMWQRWWRVSTLWNRSPNADVRTAGMSQALRCTFFVRAGCGPARLLMRPPPRFHATARSQVSDVSTPSREEPQLIQKNSALHRKRRVREQKASACCMVRCFANRNGSALRNAPFPDTWN